MKSVTLALEVAGNEQTTCGASLMVLEDDSYNTVNLSEPFTKTVGEKFILCLNKEADYAYQVAFSAGVNAGDYNIAEFSAEDY